MGNTKLTLLHTAISYGCNGPDDYIGNKHGKLWIIKNWIDYDQIAQQLDICYKNPPVPKIKQPKPVWGPGWKKTYGDYLQATEQWHKLAGQARIKAEKAHLDDIVKTLQNMGGRTTNLTCGWAQLHLEEKGCYCTNPHSETPDLENTGHVYLIEHKNLLLLADKTTNWEQTLQQSLKEAEESKNITQTANMLVYAALEEALQQPKPYQSLTELLGTAKTRNMLAQWEKTLTHLKWKQWQKAHVKYEKELVEKTLKAAQRKDGNTINTLLGPVIKNPQTSAQDTLRAEANRRKLLILEDKQIKMFQKTLKSLP